MNKKIFATLAIVMLLFSWFPASAAVIDGTPELPDYVTVELKTVSVQVHGAPTNITARIYTNENAPEGVNISLQSGFANNGKGYEWVVDKLSHEDANLIHRIIVLDLPGHGLSGTPLGVPESMQNFKDYTDAIKGFYEALLEEGITVDYVVVHSMADSILSQLQQEVNLKKYGVKAVIAVSGVPLYPVDWTWLTNGGFDLNKWFVLVVYDQYGLPYLSFDLSPETREAWRDWLMTGRGGKLNKDYPSDNKIRECVANESLLGVALPIVRLKMVSTNPSDGFVPDNNLSVRPGIYADGPDRWDIVLKNDPVVLWENGVNNHEYLTQEDPEIYEENNDLKETGKGEIKKGGVISLNEVHSFFLVPSGAQKLSHQIVKIIKKTEKEEEN